MGERSHSYPKGGASAIFRLNWRVLAGFREWTRQTDPCDSRWRGGIRLSENDVGWNIAALGARASRFENTAGGESFLDISISVFVSMDNDGLQEGSAICLLK